MTVYTHLYGVMKSLANNDYKKALKKKTESFTNDAGEEKLKIAVQVSTPSPETLLIEREHQEERERNAEVLAKQVLDLFSDDEDATWVLMGRMDDTSAEEIRELSGLDKKRYATTLRRISRKLTTNFPHKKKN